MVKALTGYLKLFEFELSSIRQKTVLSQKRKSRVSIVENAAKISKRVIKAHPDTASNRFFSLLYFALKNYSQNLLPLVAA